MTEPQLQYLAYLQLFHVLSDFSKRALVLNIKHHTLLIT